MGFTNPGKAIEMDSGSVVATELRIGEEVVDRIIELSKDFSSHEGKPSDARFIAKGAESSRRPKRSRWVGQIDKCFRI